MSEELIARLQQMKDAVGLPNECLERATYLHAMEPEGLSTIEQQSMETLYRAADLIVSQAAEIERVTAEQERAAIVAEDLRKNRDPAKENAGRRGS